MDKLTNHFINYSLKNDHKNIIDYTSSIFLKNIFTNLLYKNFAKTGELCGDFSSHQINNKKFKFFHVYQNHKANIFYSLNFLDTLAKPDYESKIIPIAQNNFMLIKPQLFKIYSNNSPLFSQNTQIFHGISGYLNKVNNHKLIIITSIENCLTQYKFDTQIGITNIENGKTLDGYYHGLQILLPEYEKFIDKSTHYFLIGNSLRANILSLLVYYLASKYPNKYFTFYSICPTKICTKEFQDKIKTLPNLKIYRFQNKNDPLLQMPFPFFQIYQDFQPIGNLIFPNFSFGQPLPINNTKDLLELMSNKEKLEILKENHFLTSYLKNFH